MTAPTYRKFPHYGLVHPIALIAPRWEVTDGIGGPVLLSGRRLTRRGAEKAAAKAAATCVPVPYVTRADRPVLHPLTREEACWICAVLEASGVPVSVEICGLAVVVTPLRALTTAQEVRALTAVLVRTVAPGRWAGVAGPPRPSRPGKM